MNGIPIALIFGWMLIGSLFILIGWGLAAWRHRHPVNIWNAGLLMALGMDLHSIGMIMQLYGRLEQMLVDGASFATDDPIFFGGALLVVSGKSLFVWVAALREGRSFSRRLWCSYWLAMLAWALLVWRFF